MSILQNCPFYCQPIFSFLLFFFTIELCELFMYIFEKLSPHHSQCFHVFIAFTRLSFSFGNGFLLWLNSYMIIYISLNFFFLLIWEVYLRNLPEFTSGNILPIFFFWSMCYIFITYMYLSIFLSTTCRRHCLFLC